jgi:hypothetical protein
MRMVTSIQAIARDYWEAIREQRFMGGLTVLLHCARSLEERPTSNIVYFLQMKPRRSGLVFVRVPFV